MHQSPKNILITGGSGAIGRRLTDRLLSLGHGVTHLGRGGKQSSVKAYRWDPSRKQIDRAALTDVDTIVHLAGAGINQKRWNEEVRREIYSSRVDTARLLVDTLRDMPSHSVRTFVSASGVSYYGLDEPHGGAFVETDRSGPDFLARVANNEEDEVRLAAERGVRTVMVRTGLAFMKDDGALKTFAIPVRLFVGAPLGSGAQWVNWIHVDDLCEVYIRAIEDSTVEGAFNAVAPNPVTNRELTKEIASVLRRPLWLPPVPGFVIELIAGEVAEYVIKGGKVSSDKIESTGFKFRFPKLRTALQDLLIN